MSKKILNVSPTKNPGKFIFETEMPADELKQILRDKFGSKAGDINIDDVKPTGLWKDKLFVYVSYEVAMKPELVLSELYLFQCAFNKKIEAKKHDILWSIHCKSCTTTRDYVLANTREYAEKLIAHLKAGSEYAQLIDVKKNMCVNADVDTIKVFNEKNEQIWPRETEHFYRITCGTTTVNSESYDLLPDVAQRLVETLETIDDKTVDVFFSDATGRSLCYRIDAFISITNSDGKVVWQKKQHCTIELAHHTGVIHVSHETADTVILQIKEYRRCVEERTPTAGCIHVRSTLDDHVIHFNDIKHIYDENGHDMLADGLAKAQKPEEKNGCVIGPNWKYPIKKSFIPKLISMLSDTNVEVIDIARSHYGPISVFKTAILEVKDENNEIIWCKRPTNFKAPSLLSRIYE